MKLYIAFILILITISLPVFAPGPVARASVYAIESSETSVQDFQFYKPRKLRKGMPGDQERKDTGIFPSGKNIGSARLIFNLDYG